MNLIELNIAREVCIRERKKILDNAKEYLTDDEFKDREMLFEKQIIIEQKMLNIVKQIVD